MSLNFGMRCSTVVPNKPPLTEQNLPDQKGKVFLVTGASGGLGQLLVDILYRHNGKVYLAARSQSKTEEVIQEIKSAHPSSTGELHFLHLDLDDLSTIKPAATRFLEKESRLDVLWNNAGVMIPPEGSKTKQGYELQYGVNNITHFLLTLLLRPALEAAAASAPKNSVRVVWVASSAADAAPNPAVDLTNMDYHREGAWMKYSRSKAASVIHSAEFAQRTKGTGIISLALNPGNFVTNLQQNMSKMELAMFKLISSDPINGAYTELWTVSMVNVTGFEGGLGQVGVHAYTPGTQAARDHPQLSADITFPATSFWTKSLRLQAGIVQPYRIAPQLINLISSGVANTSFITTAVINIEDAPEYYKRFNRTEEVKVLISFSR
ncbi:hypothetical protein FOXG_08986 [Fusarium oxysporum f. sp. lycopersici 4287]|uniref:Oxidoreductase n=2 Tax=Fusarium oxysporum TaxID=5507 RepID=A0A0J9V8Y0_FUSO4|nr:hypothetical protein FOXG_08986 [Fusarium oxysporum f. sp. lycopersici 4287]EXK36858.1 hypothetical protein FOMG_07750 [Fusarium oxysporum f. sp. melonis 26406]KNB07944.1 hypothetical protein FOXG_08986 [Fusarium oxysporum f. sp. lycopersici 4287]